MSTTAEKPEAAEQAAETTSALTRRGAAPLVSEHGSTTIADSVVAKVAGLAAREVAGVHDLGGSATRAVGTVTSRVGLADRRAQGVSVEVGQREAAVDLTVVVEYGESIPRVADDVRDQVVRRIEGITGLTVTEVNIDVRDLHFEGDEDDEEPRVA